MGLLLSHCFAVGPCLGATGSDDTVAAAATIAQEGDEKVGDENKANPDKAATDKDQVAPEGIADGKQAEPKPVGKLGIRKGTGRPADRPAVVNHAVQVQEVVVIPHDEIPVAEPVGDDLAALELMRKQIEPQWRSVLHAEIYLVHLVCQTNRQERQQLIAAMEPEFTKAVTAAARQAIGPSDPVQLHRLQLRRAGGFESPQPQRLPQEVIRESLIRLAAVAMDEERVDRLREEYKHSVEAERRAAISNVIAQLDAFLGLSAQQQEKLVEILLSSWRDDWRSVPAQVHPQYPSEMQVPAAALKVLSADQAKQWASLPKIHFEHHFPQPLNIDRPEAADRWKAELERLDEIEQAGGQTQ
jgi:hypothetical protein